MIGLIEDNIRKNAWQIMYMPVNDATLYCAYREHANMREFDSKVLKNRNDALARCDHLNKEVLCVGFCKGKIPV